MTHSRPTPGQRAVVRVRAASGRLVTFDADHVRVDDGLVTATGRWRNDRHRRRRSYTWARSQLVEIRWAQVVA